MEKARPFRSLMVAVTALALMVGGCSNRKGGQVKHYNHSTYPHHYHDGNGNPHARAGTPPPPPHNHHHGPTWRK